MQTYGLALRSAAARTGNYTAFREILAALNTDHRDLLEDLGLL